MYFYYTHLSYNSKASKLEVDVFTQTALVCFTIYGQFNTLRL